MNIAVMGSGGWGLAMAKCMAEKGHSVAVWSHKPETTAMLRRDRCNPKLLRGVTLPAGISFTDDPGCARGCPIVVIAVPVVLFTFVGVNTLLPGLHSYG